MKFYSDWYSLLIYLLVGVFLAFLYDFYNSLVIVLKLSRNWLRVIGDFLYWLIATASIIIILVNYNDGFFRFVLLFFTLIGGIIYFVIFSKFISRVLISLFKFIVNILKRLFWLSKMLLIILLKPFVIILSPILFLFKKINYFQGNIWAGFQKKIANIINNINLRNKKEK